MFKYLFKVFERSFKENLSMYIRPIINTISFFIFGKFLMGKDYSFIVFGGFTMFIQLDLIIVPNFKYYLLYKSEKVSDIKLSGITINKFIFMDSFLYLALLVLQHAIFSLIYLGYIGCLLSIFMSVISICLGFLIIPITHRQESFKFSSRIGSILCTFGAIAYPIIAYPKILKYLFLINIYTPICEMIRGIYYKKYISFSINQLICFFIIDLILYLLIYFIIKKVYLKNK